jgi:MFS family permease
VRRTNVRHAIVIATTLAAFLMYLDRVCIAWIINTESFNRDIPLDTAQSDLLKGAFFWAYALAQVPAGWLAERFGKRFLMTFMILTWSAFTALSSFSDGLTMLLLARIGCGLAEAGAYPIATSLLSRWAHPEWRAMASSVIALGGRLGFVLAPLITAYVIAESDWRWAGWLYGAAGIFAAILFWNVFRETPEQHPLCNEAERAYLYDARYASQGPRTPVAFPLKAVLTDTSLWLMCAVQFLTNVGWAFAVNSMAGHFTTVYHVSDKTNGLISTLALLIGMCGMLIGGFVTDVFTRRLGLRLGRLVPMAATRFLAAGTFALCIWVDSLPLLVLLLGLMVFWTDAGLPAMWAWAQDVGGRQVAPIMGWANMWGNFGAALQPMLLLYALRFDTGNGKTAFIASSAAFALAGVLSLGINAAKPVVAEEEATQG